MTKNKQVGARLASNQLILVRQHMSEMFQIIDKYEIRTPAIERASGCICSLSEIEHALYEIGWL